LCHGSVTLEDSDVKAWIALAESLLFPISNGRFVPSHLAIGIARDTSELAANVLASLLVSELEQPLLCDMGCALVMADRHSNHNWQRA